MSGVAAMTTVLSSSPLNGSPPPSLKRARPETEEAASDDDLTLTESPVRKRRPSPVPATATATTPSPYATFLGDALRARERRRADHALPYPEANAPWRPLEPGTVGGSSVRRFSEARQDEMWTTVARWLLDSVAYFTLRLESLFLALGMLQQVWCTHDIPRKRLQLAASACLSLACKLEEINHPSADALMYMTDHSYTVDELCAMEPCLTNALEFHLHSVTALAVLDWWHTDCRPAFAQVSRQTWHRAAVLATARRITGGVRDATTEGPLLAAHALAAACHKHCTHLPWPALRAHVLVPVLRLTRPDLAIWAPRELFAKASCAPWESSECERFITELNNIVPPF